MPIRVAIVDDHHLVRDALSQLLSAQPDIEVVAWAGDGKRALRIAREARPDVLLLDIVLPDANGLDLIERLRQGSPATRILVLSMYSEPQVAAQARERGACGLIAKSAPLDELLRAIRVLAGGGELPIEGELTDRERAILARIGEGASTGEIAASLGLQRKTVETYSQQLMAKLGVRTRAGLVTCARRLVRSN